MEETAAYLEKIKKALVVTANKNEKYLDLAQAAVPESFDRSQWQEEKAPHLLLDFLATVLAEVQAGQVERVKLGINELLKAYLAGSKEAEDKKHSSLPNAHLCFLRLRQVVEACLKDDFPFAAEIWDYTGKCLQNIGLYLLQKGLTGDIPPLLDTMAVLGKKAARMGLPTETAQTLLRLIELKSREDTARQARSIRFQIEN